jgi:DNA-binding response OmpR family regulator
MSGYRILIIDDEEFAHEVLGEYLDLSGYMVDHAYDGEKGLAAIVANVPDLVLLDIQMPVMDGFQTLEEIRKKPEFQDLPVLFLTSLDRDNLKVKGLELGADDYITKPFNKAEILARIKVALRRTTRYSKNNSAMSGNLSDLSMPELLQTLELGKKTGKVNMPDIDGEIWLKNGSLKSVRQGEFFGEEAFNRLIFLEKGSFNVEFGQLPPEIEELQDTGLQFLLMNALKYIDELKVLMADLPAANQLVEISGDCSKFATIEKLKDVSPINLVDLMVRMEETLKDNVKTLINAVNEEIVKVVV